jgi:dihydroorotate dehydrogenase
MFFIKDFYMMNNTDLANEIANALIKKWDWDISSGEVKARSLGYCLNTISKNEIADYLQYYNMWRRGADVVALNVTELGLILDLAVAYIRSF